MNLLIKKQKKLIRLGLKLRRQKMLEKRMYCKRPLLFFFASFVFFSPLAFSIPTSSPSTTVVSPTAESYEITLLRNNIKNKEQLVNNLRTGLNTCKRNCVRACQAKCEENETCNCSSQLCEEERCSEEHRIYNKHYSELNTLSTQLTKLLADAANSQLDTTGQSSENQDATDTSAETQEQDEETDSDKTTESESGDSTDGNQQTENEGENPQYQEQEQSPVEKVVRQRNKMKDLAIAGGVVTGVLAAKCAACSSFCIYCPATAVALAATAAMASQKDKFTKIGQDMCTYSSTTGCSHFNNSTSTTSGTGGSADNTGGNPGNSAGETTLDLSSYPCDENPDLCRELQTILDDVEEEDLYPPNLECPSGDTAKCPTVTPPELLALSPDSEFGKKLLKIFDPKGEWSKSDLAKLKNFSFDKISPQDQKRINNVIEQAKKKNKKLAQVFQSNQSPLSGNTSQGGMADLLGSSGFSPLGTNSLSSLDSTSPIGNSADSFTGGKKRPTTSSSDSRSDPNGDGIGKKQNLTEEMNQMLKDFENAGAENEDPLADKSVYLGSDVVGVVQDNIFMMAHRNHRTLDKKGLFNEL